jgi:hypothetical protein
MLRPSAVQRSGPVPSRAARVAAVRSLNGPRAAPQGNPAATGSARGRRRRATGGDWPGDARRLERRLATAEAHPTTHDVQRHDGEQDEEGWHDRHSRSIGSAPGCSSSAWYAQIHAVAGPLPLSSSRLGSSATGNLSISRQRARAQRTTVQITPLNPTMDGDATPVATEMPLRPSRRASNVA